MHRGKSMQHTQSSRDVLWVRNQYARLFVVFLLVSLFLASAWYDAFQAGSNKLLIGFFSLVSLGYAVYCADVAITAHYQHRNIEGEHLNRTTKRA